jgi:hypothetical protein
MVKPEPNLERRIRRVFTPDYKVSILQRADACKHGELGHGIRLWDAIAFLPRLASKKITVKYAINTGHISLVASTNVNFLECTEQILQKQQGLALHNFRYDSLKVNAQ